VPIPPRREEGGPWWATLAANCACSYGGASAARCAAEAAGEAEGRSEPAARRAQAELLRCIFGRRRAARDPVWLTPPVTNLAAVAYTERALPSGHPHGQTSQATSAPAAAVRASVTSRRPRALWATRQLSES
jgi:hypothetical protein